VTEKRGWFNGRTRNVSSILSTVGREGERKEGSHKAGIPLHGKTELGRVRGKARGSRDAKIYIGREKRAEQQKTFPRETTPP